MKRSRSPAALMRVCLVLGALACSGLSPAFGSVLEEGGHSVTGAGEYLGLSPFLSWKTLTTEHFRLTYPEELKEMAPRVAENLEEAHRLLTPVLRWTPRFRTQVLLIDNSDFANGLAAAAGRFGMVLWATPPDNWMSIAHYDDWMRMLCLHEYAHILNLDATTGFWQFLRIFAGDGTLPNGLWPSWMLEGLAVTIETVFTRAGRGRSSYYSMVLRAVEEAGILADPEGLWRIGGPRTDPPGGETPYLFGSMLMSEMASRDLKLLGDLSLESSGGFPWRLNHYAREVSTRDWQQHWSEWQRKARERAQSELSAVRGAGETQLQPVTSGNYATLGIAFSPDGRWMAYSREAMDRRQGVYLREVATGEELRINDQLGGSSLGFTADSKGLVYSRLDRQGLFNFFSDLWVHDIPSGRRSRLSDGARYRDPSLSLNGPWVVFTVNEGGRISLARSRLIRLEDGNYRFSEKEVLYRPELWGRVATPRIAPDGSRIVFSLHENGKPGESIWELVKDSVGGGEAGFWRQRRVTEDGTQLDRFPFFDPMGSLYFVSNRSGVDNIYRWNAADSKAEPITNVTTGLWLPAFSRMGRLAASHYTARGWNAVWVDAALTDASHPPQLLPVEVPMINTAVASENFDSSPKSAWEVSDYSIFPSILPRSWTPYLAYGTTPGWIAGAVLLGFDALDLHRYLARVGGQFGLQEWEGDLSYSNRSLGAVWTLHGSRTVGSILSQSYSRRMEAGLELSLLYPRTFSAWNPSAEFSWVQEKYFATPANRPALGDGELATRIASPVFRLQLDYRGTQTSRQAVWPEEGFNFRAGNQWTLGGRLGSLSGRQVTATQALWTQQHFLHLGKHVVLSPRWQLAASNRSMVRLQGRSQGWLDVLGQADFDNLVVRGYPFQEFYARQAGVGALDLRFPIRRLEKGWSTYPIFLTTLQGMGFVEKSCQRSNLMTGWTGLPSWGVGVLADLTVFYSVPVTASVQFHQGVQSGLGGKGEVFVDLRLGQLFF